MPNDLVINNGNVGIGQDQALSRLTVKAKAAFDLTGTVAKVASGSTLTGTGTLFLSQVGAGDTLLVPSIDGEYRVVSSVVSDTELTITDTFDDTGSGLTAKSFPAAFRAVPTVAKPASWSTHSETWR